MCVDDSICNSQWMDKIDEMLNRWIYNSKIRERIRELIIKAIQEAYNRGYRDGGSVGQ